MSRVTCYHRKIRRIQLVHADPHTHTHADPHTHTHTHLVSDVHEGRVTAHTIHFSFARSVSENIGVKTQQ